MIKYFAFLVIVFTLICSCSKEEPIETKKEITGSGPAYFSPPEWLQESWINSSMQYIIMHFNFTPNNIYYNGESIANIKLFSLEIIEKDNVGRPSYLIGTNDTSFYWKFTYINKGQVFWTSKFNKKKNGFYLYSEFSTAK